MAAAGGKLGQGQDSTRFVYVTRFGSHRCGGVLRLGGRRGPGLQAGGRLEEPRGAAAETRGGGALFPGSEPGGPAASSAARASSARSGGKSAARAGGAMGTGGRGAGCGLTGPPFTLLGGRPAGVGISGPWARSALPPRGRRPSAASLGAGGWWAAQTAGGRLRPPVRVRSVAWAWARGRRGRSFAISPRTAPPRSPRMRKTHGPPMCSAYFCVFRECFVLKKPLLQCVPRRWIFAAVVTRVSSSILPPRCLSFVLTEPLDL